MSIQKTSTDERQAEIALLEDLIEEVDGRMDRADEQARNAAGSVPMLKSSGAASAYQSVREELTERKERLGRARDPSVDFETTRRKDTVREAALSSDGSSAYWCPRWDAVIRWGGSSTEWVREDGRVGRTEYVTRVTFAVSELARRDGDIVIRDTRHRLMGSKTLPTAEALKLVEDECIPLERVSASAEARDPSARYHGVKKYRVVES